MDLRVGHVLDVLRDIPDATIHMAVCSPPYYGLRSYEVADQVWGGDSEHEHEWTERVKVPAQTGGVGKSTLGEASGGNAISDDGRVRSQLRQTAQESESAFCSCGAWLGQLGLEPTPELFIEHLVGVFREVRRVLRPDGSLWVNMGDSYASTSTYNGLGSMATRNGWKDSGVRPNAGLPPGYKAKDLIGVPWMLAFALRTDGWWLRSENIWHKLGGMPESVFDRTSRAHEHVFHLTPSRNYFYDTDAVREPYAKDNRRKTTVKAGENSIQHRDGERWPHPEGKIKRSVWRMATANYPGAHFAVFPLELPDVCIRATTSERGACPECGAPWERIVEAEGETVEQRKARQNGRYHDLDIAPRSDGGALQQGVRVGGDGERRTIGWEPSCACRDTAQLAIPPSGPPPYEPVPCVVLDPFVGSGTTMVAARRLGRSSIGIEASEQYAETETARRIAEWWKDPVQRRDEPIEGQEALFT